MKSKHLVALSVVVLTLIVGVTGIVLRSTFTAEVAVDPPCLELGGDAQIPGECGGGTPPPPPSCQPDPPFDVAFQGQTDSSFGTGFLGAANLNSPFTKAVGVESAAAQSGGNQLSESKKFEIVIKTAITDSLREYKFKYDLTLAFLRNPGSWFDNQTNLDRFASTFSSEIVEVISDPTLPYYARVRAAQQAAPDAFKRGMEQFVYGKLVNHTEAKDATPSKDNPWVLQARPDWSEWLTTGLKNFNVDATVYNWVSGNSGRYTKCDIDLGVASGGSSNRFKGLGIKVDYASQTTGFQLVGKGLFTPNLQVGAQYSIRF